MTYFIQVSALLHIFAKGWEKWTKNINFGKVKLEALANYKAYKMLTKNHKWLEFHIYNSFSKLLFRVTD